MGQDNSLGKRRKITSPFHSCGNPSVYLASIEMRKLFFAGPLEYLLQADLGKMDSQHFWDLMDALPEENISKAEREIMDTVFKEFNLETDTIFYDATNFFTFISTTNTRNTLAQRGKNKQKRNDLRQVGMALVVSKKDQIPLFHHTYQGNLNDVSIFKSVIKDISKRIKNIGLGIVQFMLLLTTDQKIKVHNFICVIGYLLSALLHKELRSQANYKGNINTMLNELKNIRLATVLTKNKEDGKIKTEYKIEQMSTGEEALFQALGLQKLLKNRVKIKGVSIYN
jgi:transposase